MTVAAIVKSRLLKMAGAKKKIKYLNNQVEAASKIMHAVTMWIYTFVEKKWG